MSSQHRRQFHCYHHQDAHCPSKVPGMAAIGSWANQGYVKNGLEIQEADLYCLYCQVCHVLRNSTARDAMCVLPAVPSPAVPVPAPPAAAPPPSLKDRHSGRRQ